MNLLLIRDGYTPVSIGPEHRSDYIAVLEPLVLAEPIGHGVTDAPARARYFGFMAGRLVASLEDHLSHLGVA